MTSAESDDTAAVSRASVGRSVGLLLGCVFAIGIAADGANLVVARIWPSAFDPAGRLTGTIALIVTLLLHAGLVVAASYAAARLAPNRPRAHALALGFILAGLTVLFPILRLGGKDMATGWFHLVDLVLTLAGARLGAALFARAQDRFASRRA